MKLPQGHQTVMPYLILPGVAEFIEFATKVFNAKTLAVHPADGGGIMHAEINIEGSTIMMGDSSERWEPRPASLYIYSEDVDSAYKRALTHGAKTILEPEDKPYGRSCGVGDPFGNVWWITAAPKM